MLENIIASIVNSISNSFNYELDRRSMITELESYTNNLYNKLRLTKNYLFRKEPIDSYENYLPLTLSDGKLKIRITNPSDFINEFPKTIILGTAGSGKTTLLKYITLRCIDQNDFYPVYIELRNYNKEQSSFNEFVANSISEKFNTEILEGLKMPKFIFMFDGYDEIDYTSGIDTIYQMEKFITTYDKNRFIISSRKGTNIESLPQFKVFEILPLDYNDIFKYVERLRLPSTKTNRLYKHIEEDPFFQQYLTTPLLLSVYINYFTSTPDLDLKAQNSIFFRNIVDTLFSRHDSVSKLGFIRNRLSGLTKDELESVSTTLAFRAFIQSKNSFTLDALNSELSKIKKHLNIRFENEKLIYDLTITVNILIRSSNYYSFPHILIQEYFAALFISRLPSHAKEEIYYTNILKGKISASPTILSFFYELDKQSFLKNFLIPYFGYDQNEIHHISIQEFADTLRLPISSKDELEMYMMGQLKDIDSSGYLKDLLNLE